MARKLITPVLVLLALIPSIYLAWSYREMPQLGHLHDDAIYLVCGRSIANGHGYRISSLPSEPFQTKYPPLYPFLLSLLWKVSPGFPENLKLGTLLAWLFVPLLLWLVNRVWIAMDIGLGERRVLLCVLAINSYVVFCGMTLLTELPFTCLLMASLLAAERGSLSAGFLGGAAYLTRTAALPLLATGPLCLLLKRQPKKAAIMLAPLAAAVIGWLWWAGVHQTSATDLVSLYYTNYLGFRKLNAPLSALPLLIWKNTDNLCGGIAGLLMPQLADGDWGRRLARLLAVVTIAGTIRHARRTGLTQFHCFTAAYVPMLLMWHYPPDERFLLPVYPVLLAGFACEARHLVEVIRKGWNVPANRKLAPIMAAAVAMILCIGLWTNGRSLIHQLPTVYSQQRTLVNGSQGAFSWIREHAPPDAAFFACDDPVLFLYTQRRACSLPVSPLPFYRQDRNAILRPFRHFAAFAREEHLTYAVLTVADFHRDLPPSEGRDAQKLVRASASGPPVYQSRLVSIYEISAAAESLARLEPDRRMPQSPDRPCPPYGRPRDPECRSAP